MKYRVTFAKSDVEYVTEDKDLFLLFMAGVFTGLGNSQELVQFRLSDMITRLEPGGYYSNMLLTATYGEVDSKD